MFRRSSAEDRRVGPYAIFDRSSGSVARTLQHAMVTQQLRAARLAAYPQSDPKVNLLQPQ
jgi:hypothetical protein